MAAPLAGRVADRRGPEGVTRMGAALALVAFAAMAFSPLLSTNGRLWLIGGSAVLFDLGIQASLVAHQTIVYSIEPGARCRLDAMLFVGMFIGMALGAALGSVLLARWGWPSVTGLAATSAAGALVVRRWPSPRVGEVAGSADATAAAAGKIERDVTCGGLGPQNDAVFQEEARGGSLQ